MGPVVLLTYHIPHSVLLTVVLSTLLTIYHSITLQYVPRTTYYLPPHYASLLTTDSIPLTTALLTTCHVQYYLPQHYASLWSVTRAAYLGAADVAPEGERAAGISKGRVQNHYHTCHTYHTYPHLSHLSTPISRDHYPHLL